MIKLTIEELRGLQLSILDRFDAFCRSEGLDYQLAFGTLLGAVREGGYIPWDDDLDLSMTRDHYDRFIQSFPLYRPDLHLGAPGREKDWPYPFAKLSDTRTVLVEATELQHSLGVNIDIFPIDSFPSNRLANALQLSLLGLLKAILILKGLTLREGRSRWKVLFLGLLQPITHPLSQSYLATTIAHVASWHSREYGTEAGILVGSVVWRCPRHALLCGRSLQFEGRESPVPIEYKQVLSSIYGPDYHLRPPIDKQRSHHRFAAYWRPGCAG